jgi:hypothetical protein
MKVAIPGLFHTLQAAHFLLFERIMAMATKDLAVTIDLLVMVDHRFDEAGIASMLRSIRQVSAVHILQSASQIREAFLVSKGFMASLHSAPLRLP